MLPVLQYIYSPTRYLIEFLLVLRFQLCMFRTVTVHPQEILYMLTMVRGKKHTTRYVRLVQRCRKNVKLPHLFW